MIMGSRGNLTLYYSFNNFKGHNALIDPYFETLLFVVVVMNTLITGYSTAKDIGVLSTTWMY